MGLAMADKLIDAARARRRVVNAPHMVARVRAGPCATRETACTTRRYHAEISTGPIGFDPNSCRLNLADLQVSTISHPSGLAAEALRSCLTHAVAPAAVPSPSRVGQ